MEVIEEDEGPEVDCVLGEGGAVVPAVAVTVAVLIQEKSISKIMYVCNIDTCITNKISTPYRQCKCIKQITY